MKSRRKVRERKRSSNKTRKQKYMERKRKQGDINTKRRINRRGEKKEECREAGKM